MTNPYTAYRVTAIFAAVFVPIAAIIVGILLSPNHPEKATRPTLVKGAVTVVIALVLELALIFASAHYSALSDAWKPHAG